MGFLDTAIGAVTGALQDVPIVGSMAAGAASAYGAAQQQKMSKEMAKDQMKFQERMSSTAHQREVADLREAGLNPILSAQKGASSPGGAMGQAQNIAQSGVTSALHSMKTKQETDNMRATYSNILEEIKRTRAQTRQSQKSGNLLDKQAFTESMKGILTNKSISEKQMQIEILIEQLKGWKREGEITDTELGKYLRWLKEITGAIGLSTSMSSRIGK